MSDKKKLITRFDLEESSKIIEKWSSVVFPVIREVYATTPLGTIETSFKITRAGVVLLDIDMEDSKIRDIIHDHFEGDKNKAVQYCIDEYNKEMQDLRENATTDIIKRCQDTLKLITRITSMRVPKRKPKTGTIKWSHHTFKSPGVYTREVDYIKTVTKDYIDSTTKDWSAVVGAKRGKIPKTKK